MATQAKTAKTYKVDYKKAVKEIKNLKKSLAAIKSKVSVASQSEIKTEIEVMDKIAAFCGGGGKKMSKTYA